MIKQILPVLAVCAMVATLAFQIGCTKQTKVADIIASPITYEGKGVVIRGTVTGNLWLRSITTGLYRVLDDKSSIWVVTSQAPPQEGTKVTVKGTVASAAIIADQSWVRI